MQYETTVNSAEETFETGEKLGKYLEPGDIVTLNGMLGAGKTVFTKGLAKALNVAEEITSPTYTLMNIYESGDVPLYHYDAYRLGDAEDLYDIGFWDNVPGSVSVVEWAENVLKNGGQNTFAVNIERFDSESITKRKITVDFPEGREVLL